MGCEIKCGGTTESIYILYISIFLTCKANSVSKKPSRPRSSVFWRGANRKFEPAPQLQMGRGKKIKKNGILLEFKTFYINCEVSQNKGVHLQMDG